MKVLLATILLAAVSSAIGKSDRNRELQNNYNGYQQQQYQQQQYQYQQQQQGYENFEMYMNSQISQRSFTFTGCSTISSGYAWNTVYATFRLCDSCSNRNRMGCSQDNGDYIVSMREFGEAYGEYWAQANNRNKDAAPFRCVKAEEYVKNHYMEVYYDQNGQAQQGGQQQNYNNNNNNGQEYFIGPVCDGGKQISLGLFWDEECALPVKGTTIERVIGFKPPQDTFQPPKCLSCGYMQNNYNGGNNNNYGQLNPLCDRVLEQSGRCDRTKKETDFDAFWHDVVDWANNDQNQGQQQYNNYAQNQNQAYDLNDMDYFQFQNQNTCDMIDSLPHMKGFIRGPSSRSILTIIAVGLVAFAAYVIYARDGRIGLKGVNLWAQKDIPLAEYYRESDQPEIA